MRTSEDLDLLAAALCAFQGEMPIVPKLHKGKIEGKSKATGKEYSYEYDYADLGDVIDAARAILLKHGLSVSQMVGWEDGRDVLTTIVLHQSGQWLADTARLVVPEVATPQVQGSATTYGRRYHYCAALGLVADTDDDGRLAELAYGAGSSRTRKPPKSSTPTGGKLASRASRAQDPATDDGQAAMSARDRNKVISHFARAFSPPIVGEAVDAYLRNTLDIDVPLVKLSAPQGHVLMVRLGLVADVNAEAPPPEELKFSLPVETPEARDARVARELAVMEGQSDEPF